MPWAIFDYRSPSGANEFYEWCGTLQKRELAKVNARIDMLEEYGPNLAPKILAGPIKGWRHIYKLTINGRIAVRPLLCKGTEKPNDEFTLLIGAFEVGGEWKPANAPSEADLRREAV